jgi:PIN like domain
MNGRPEVFFTDRDLGKRFPEILREAGLTVQGHGNHFESDTPDEVWLAAVGARGWIGLTHDRHIRYKPNERDAVMRHGVPLLVVVGAAPFPELAHNFVVTLPRVRRFLVRNRPPFIAKVYRPTPARGKRSGSVPGRVERPLERFGPSTGRRHH